MEKTGHPHNASASYKYASVATYKYAHLVSYKFAQIDKNKSIKVRANKIENPMSLEINPNEKTGNEKMDNFFKTQFEPCTGMWIRKHPEIKRLDYLYKKYYKTT